MMLVVEEAPEYGDQCIENRYSSIEWQFGYLRCRQFSIRVAELDDGLVVVCRVLVCKHAVVACLLDLIFDRLRVLQMYCVGEDKVPGFLGRIGCQNELADVLFFAEPVFDLLFLADTDFLYRMSDYRSTALHKQLFHT